MKSVCAERTPRSRLADPLFLLCQDVSVSLNVGPFDHARSALTHLRFGLLSFHTGFLILLANGMTEALRQLVLS